MQRKSENTHTLELPDEILLNTFSFFAKNSAALSRFQQVNKQWNNVANDDALWRQMIKPAFYEALKHSSLSAKEFYKNHMYARIQTFYYVGKEIQVSNFSMGYLNFTESRPISLTENDLLACLENTTSDTYVFTDREQAIAYADHCSSRNCPSKGYEYTPVFTFRCPDMSIITNARSHILSLSKPNSHYSADNSHVTFMQLIVPPSAFTTPIEIFYKTSYSLPSSSRRDWQSHVVSVTDKKIENQNNRRSIG